MHIASWSQPPFRCLALDKTENHSGTQIGTKMHGHFTQDLHQLGNVLQNVPIMTSLEGTVARQS